MYYSDISNDHDWFKNHIICSPQVVFECLVAHVNTQPRGQSEGKTRG